MIFDKRIESPPRRSSHVSSTTASAGVIRQVTHLDGDVAVETDLYYDGVRRISERSQEREQAIPPLQGMVEILAECESP